MEYEPGDVLLCTVDKITGTNVFVDIAGTTKTGSIVFSEIAPGRIRNIRDYVVPKKTICCKVLKVSNNHLELSFRRVKEKERKEIIEQNKIEKSYSSIVKTILKEKTKDMFTEIKKTSSIYDFLENAKEDAKELEKLIGKENSDKILEILKTQKKKTFILKKEIFLTTSKKNGLEIIKKILGNIKEAEIRYLAAGKYSIKREDDELKKADNKLMEIINKIEQDSKKNGIEFKFK